MWGRLPHLGSEQCSFRKLCPQIPLAFMEINGIGIHNWSESRSEEGVLRVSAPQRFLSPLKKIMREPR